MSNNDIEENRVKTWVSKKLDPGSAFDLVKISLKHHFRSHTIPTDTKCSLTIAVLAVYSI